MRDVIGGWQPCRTHFIDIRLVDTDITDIADEAKLRSDRISRMVERWEGRRYGRQRGFHLPAEDLFDKLYGTSSGGIMRHAIRERLGDALIRFGQRIAGRPLHVVHVKLDPAVEQQVNDMDRRVAKSMRQFGMTA